VLGLAFTPEYVETYDAFRSGGICEKRQRFQGDKNMPAGIYSTNTLIVTQTTFGRRMPDAVLSLAFTHELGLSVAPPSNCLSNAMHSIGQSIKSPLCPFVRACVRSSYIS